MPLVARRMSVIKPSPTLAATQKAAEMKRKGIDVIALSAGEPDFDTPDHVKAAGIEAIKRGDTKYTDASGTAQLKKAVIDKLKRENGLEYEASEIIIGCGAKHVIYNALAASLDEGDEVIIPAPYWVSYPDMTLLCGGKPVIIACGEDCGFKLTARQLEQSITPATKWLFINSPSNPTGACYTAPELAALAEVLKKHPHVNILSDDIYEPLVYDGGKFVSILDVSPELKNRTLVVNGVSKSHSMTGWRIGYGAGDKALIKAMGIIQSQSTSNPCSISQAAAVEALNGDQSFLPGWRESFRQRRDLVLNRLNAMPGITCRKPEGAFYLYPSCAGIIGKKTPDGNVIQSSNDFVDYLLESAHVAVVAGEGFGLDPFFRISYATSEKVLQTACDRITKAIQELK